MQYVSENGIIDWRQVKINAAIAAMQGIISNQRQMESLDPVDTPYYMAAEEANLYASELVNVLQQSIPTVH